MKNLKELDKRLENFEIVCIEDDILLSKMKEEDNLRICVTKSISGKHNASRCFIRYFHVLRLKYCSIGNQFFFQ